MFEMQVRWVLVTLENQVSVIIVVLEIRVRKKPLARPYAICACRMKRQLN